MWGKGRERRGGRQKEKGMMERLKLRLWFQANGASCKKCRTFQERMTKKRKKTCEKWGFQAKHWLISYRYTGSVEAENKLINNQTVQLLFQTSNYSTLKLEEIYQMWCRLQLSFLKPLGRALIKRKYIYIYKYLKKMKRFGKLTVRATLGVFSTDPPPTLLVMKIVLPANHQLNWTMQDT